MEARAFVITGITGEASGIFGLDFTGLGSSRGRAAENNTPADTKQTSIKLVLNKLVMPMSLLTISRG